MLSSKEKVEFSVQDIANLKKTVLVGMPSVGKSKISDTISKMAVNQGYELEVFSTDEYFAAIRQDEEHPAIKKAKKDNPGIDMATIQKSSAFIEQYGDKAFRQMESDTIRYALGESLEVDGVTYKPERNLAEGKMLNLGGKAILHPQTAECLKKQGYTVIYLKSDLMRLYRNALRDFKRSQKGVVIHRSNVNDPVLDSMLAVDKDITREVNKTDAGKYLLDLFKTSQFKKLKKTISVLHARDKKLMEILKDFKANRSAGYRSASSEVITMTPFFNINLQKVISVIKGKAKQQTQYNTVKKDYSR